MIGWIVALVVWTAAGARAGRVVARTPTPLRMAMVMAVTCAALATTLFVSKVWGLVDALAPDSDLPEMLEGLLWTGFASASVVGAVSVWPKVSRSRMRPLATIVYTAAMLVGVALVFGWQVPALVFIAIALIVVVQTGVRHIAWAPLGRGIGLIVVGTVIILLATLVRLAGELTGNSWRIAEIWVYDVAALTVALGAVWVLIETWIRARRDLRRLHDLRQVLIHRFPEVLDEGSPGSTTVLRVSDFVAQSMDALYIQAGAGLFEVAQVPPTSPRAQARIVAAWIEDPVNADVLDTEWIAPPDGMSSRRWVLLLSDAYSADRSRRSVPA